MRALRLVTALQGMIGLGRISMRVSKGLGASLALSEEDGLLLPTLVMFRDGKFMRSTHIAPSQSRDSLRLLVARTYEFVYRFVLRHLAFALKLFFIAKRALFHALFPQLSF